MVTKEFSSDGTEELKNKRFMVSEQWSRIYILDEAEDAIVICLSYIVNTRSDE